MRPLLLVEDDDLLDRLRVAEPDAEHEPVELRLGQRERALVLDRVLGGDDEERVGHLVGRAVDRGLALLHAFEQRGLRLGRRPVDLVGEDDLADDRARPELELLGLLVVDRQAGHVGGQEVRGELDPPERAAEAAARSPWRGPSCRCPGTSSIRRWPRHSRATRARRTSWCLPTMTRSTLARTLSPVSWILVIGLSHGLGRRTGAPGRGGVALKWRWSVWLTWQVTDSTPGAPQWFPVIYIDAAATRNVRICPIRRAP